MNTTRLCHLALAAILAPLAACDSLDDSGIPSLPVTVNLGDAGMWNSFGVHAFGQYRYFIKNSEPSGFFYSANSYTGFGGVLLICGMDPFSSESGVPLAYDLACPVECKADVRVAIDPENFEAVCPVCHSHFDVTMAGGAPLSGPAAKGKDKRRMRRYSCKASQLGGYVITN